MHRGAWQAIVYGVAESRTLLKHTPPGAKARPLAL